MTNDSRLRARQSFLDEAAFLGLQVSEAGQVDLADFERLSPVAAQLPTGGRFELEAFTVICPGCGNDIEPQDRVRGRVVLHTEALMEIVAVGYCTDCRLLEPVRVRFAQNPGRPDTASWKTANGWRASTLDAMQVPAWRVALSSVVGRIRRIIKGS
ncbi:MAG: hypothetical protein E6R08_10060 [Nevskiaceae bacterium]|nr:MAG: hypothetical protein E6R08_10060 [Nevskiaceae bacterium]